MHRPDIGFEEVKRSTEAKPRSAEEALLRVPAPNTLKYQGVRHGKTLKNTVRIDGWRLDRAATPVA